MKKLNKKRSQKLAIMALSAMAFIVALIALIDPSTAAGVLAIAPIVVGGVTLEGKEAEVFTALKAEIASMKEKYDKDYISASAFEEKLNAALKAFAPNIKDNEDFKALEKSLLDQGIIVAGLKDMTTNGGPVDRKSVRDQLKKQIEEGKEDWADFVSGKSKGFNFNIDLKGAGNMLISTNVTGNNIPTHEVIPGLVGQAQVQPSIINETNYGSTGSASIQWAEKVNEDGNATLVNDTTISPLVDFDIKESTSTAKDYSASIKIHQNMLTDIDFMATEIENHLRYEVDIVTDNAVLAYIISKASAFNLTTLKLKVPNRFDAIMAAATQVISLNYVPTVAMVNPIDYAMMVGQKGTDGQYVMPPFSAANGTTVFGLPIRQSNQVTAGNVLVGAMKQKANVREIGSLQVSAGWENQDFRYRLTTFLGVRRIHNFIADNDTSAFVYDAFQDIIDNITEI